MVQQTYVLTPCSRWDAKEKKCVDGHSSVHKDDDLPMPNSVCIGSHGRHVSGRLHLVAPCVVDP